MKKDSFTGLAFTQMRGEIFLFLLFILNEPRGTCRFHQRPPQFRPLFYTFSLNTILGFLMLTKLWNEPEPPSAEGRRVYASVGLKESQATDRPDRTFLKGRFIGSQGSPERVSMVCLNDLEPFWGTTIRTAVH